MGSRCHSPFSEGGSVRAHLLPLKRPGSRSAWLHRAWTFSNRERARNSLVEGVNDEIREQNCAGTAGRATQRAESLSSRNARQCEVAMKRASVTGLLLLLVAGFGLAQSPQDNWDNLKHLRQGQRIVVVDSRMKTLKGTFVSVTDEALSVAAGKAEESVARANVVRVSVLNPSHRKRNALIGLAAGAATGVIVGVASPELGQGKCAQGSCVDAGTVSMLGFWGGASGAGIGAAIPVGATTVYRANIKPGK